MSMSIGTFTSLGKGGPSPQQSSDQRTVRGSIARAPSSGDESLFVVVPGFSLALPYEVISARWEHASNLPAAGASCLIVFDDDGDAWCPLWEGMIPGGAGGDTNTILHGTAPPDDSVGESGDFYIDDDDWLIYGPKNGSWPAGASMIGPEGDTGAPGAPGAPGVKGDKGDSGAVGPAGSQGPQGTTGATGPQGVPGVVGPTGPTGPKGADSTVPGPAGSTGPTGPAGPAGVSYEASPVGAVLTFPGKNLPVGYVLANGGTYAQGTYPQGYAFAAAEVAAGNPLWSVNASAQTFTVPDLRDRFLYSSASQAFAANGGEASHGLSVAEMPAHDHSGAGGPDGVGHGGATSAQHALHTHALGQNVYAPGPSGSAGAGAGTWLLFTQGAYGTGTESIWHWHYLATNGSNAAHNNMPPYVVLAFIVKVWGVVNNGAALVGPPGSRGNTTYLYNGAGTPAAGTFVGEIDGDWAVRKGDGENFQRQAGAWVDLGFTNRSTAATTSARAHRTAAFTPAANTWTKVPLDGLDFDVSGNLYNSANGRFVCPTAGVYDVLAMAQSSTSATGTYTNYAVGIWKNGAQFSQTNQQAAVSSVNAMTLADKIQCNAGDVLELYVFNAQGTALTLGPLGNWMAVSLDTSGPGPQGARGSNWFTYTGAGTPAAGTFLNEVDGDMATRSSDGEVFRRISGAWSDQGWKVATGQNTMDIWHLVGNAGEPAFQGGWQNYGGGFATAGFRKFPDGKVKLKGLIAAGAAGPMFTLPIGYRPPEQKLNVTEGDSGLGRVDVSTAGVVSLVSGSAGWHSIDSIEFDTNTVAAMSAGAMGPPGPGGSAYSMQRKTGNVAAYLTVAFDTTMSDGASGLMQLSITPTIPVWWEVEADVGLVSKVDAAYHYLCGLLQLSKPDQDGVSGAYHYVMQHSQVNQLDHRYVRRTFRLAANTTYTAMLQLGNSSGGSWQYYADSSRLYMDAKAWAQ